MTTFEFWKSSYSNGDRECVEVATNHPDTVAIRDSKRPQGPVLHVAPAAWVAFREAVVQGIREEM
ncbi:DUF397 domain-containing protein [Streptomyces sparsogenes]|uniref:DUF397 domain-containing protein n=1 Tax=Streptomyces sparsogenes TaxID=67365 RepID=UPI0033DA5386